MYKKDKKGSYQVLHTWIEAFDAAGAKGFYSYFQRCELRRYEDGDEVVKVGKPVYLTDRPDAIFAHKVYVTAQRELLAMVPELNK